MNKQNRNARYAARVLPLVQPLPSVFVSPRFSSRLAALAGVVGIILCLVATQPCCAEAFANRAIRDTVANVVARLTRELGTNDLARLTPAQLETFLTPRERKILGEDHLTFRVNVPVRVSILRDMRLGDQPFWLRERGFAPTSLTLREGKGVHDVWQKDFPAGAIGLGVHALSGGGNHYLVTLAPLNPADKIKVTDLHPTNLRLAECRAGVEPYVDQPDVLGDVPPELQGQILIRPDTDREEDAQIIGLFRFTQYPASTRPDQVVLTWSADPRTTQTIQWRTSTAVRSGYVRFHARDADPAKKPSRVAAGSLRLKTPTLLNDPVVHRHTATLRGLAPGTTYVYAVGNGTADGWSAPAEFTTAPAGTPPFSFLYLGDAQNGLDRWGVLLHNAFRAQPDAAFTVMAGDLVNRGAERNDWDSFFHNAVGVFDRRPLMPVIGNHECQGREPELYLKQFTLPANGPRGVPPGRAWSWAYGNALFVGLDSNLDPRSQTKWLERILSRSRAVWKFVAYHHPAYYAGGNQDNADVRAAWTPLFDKYHVDLALQGHDHSYLRTFPLRAGQRVATPQEGTVYVISVSGTKSYPQLPHDYTEVGRTNVATYQAIQLNDRRLEYRAFDINGNLRDEMVIQK